MNGNVTKQPIAANTSSTRPKTRRSIFRADVAGSPIFHTVFVARERERASTVAYFADSGPWSRSEQPPSGSGAAIRNAKFLAIVSHFLAVLRQRGKYADGDAEEQAVPPLC
jgi:hypothetical protein